MVSVWDYSCTCLLLNILSKNWGLELLDHGIQVCSVLIDTSASISRWLHQFPRPQAMEVVPLLPFSPMFHIVSFLKNLNHSGMCVHYGFNLHFLNDEWDWTLFHMLMAIWIFSSTMVSRFFCSISFGPSAFVLIDLKKFFIYFRSGSLWGICIANIFYHTWLAFSFS